MVDKVRWSENRWRWFALATCLTLSLCAVYYSHQPPTDSGPVRPPTSPQTAGDDSSDETPAASSSSSRWLLMLEPEEEQDLEPFAVQQEQANNNKVDNSNANNKTSVFARKQTVLSGRVVDSRESFKHNLGDQMGELAAEADGKSISEMRRTRSRRSTSSVSSSARRLRLQRAFRAERKPILNEFSFPANLVQGMRFVLMCQVLDGDSPVHIKWFKDNQELSEKLDEQSVELISNDELGSSLLFRRVQQQHSGNYTCLATNHFGSASYSSSMSVKVPPRWKVEPQDQESIMGEQITIDCQAVGWKFTPLHQQHHPANLQQQAGNSGASSRTERGLSVVLGHQQQQHDVSSSSSGSQQASQQQSSSSFKLINSNHHVQTLENGSLTIRQANKEHEGLYLCEADNGVEPNLIKVLKLVVHLQAQFSDDIQVLSDSNSQAQTPGHHVVVGQELTISGVDNKVVGQSQVASAQSNAPVIVGGGGGAGTGGAMAVKSIRIMQNATQLRLLCQPFGDLPLTLDWLKDGQLIYTHSTPPSSTSSVAVVVASTTDHLSLPGQVSFNSGDSSSSSSSSTSRYHVNTRKSSQRPLVGLDSELVVTNLRRTDAGLYSCFARNAYGQAERKLRLIVQEQPEAPEVVDVAHISSRSIGLRWLAPFDGNSPILKYIVEYRKHSDPSSSDNSFQDNLALSASATLQMQHQSGNSGQSEKIMPLKSLTEPNLGQTIVGSSVAAAQQQQQQQQVQVQHAIHDLEPLTRYSMRVVAVNAVGRSKPSVALSLRTEEEVPSVVPSLVEAVVLSSKSIKLHWTISYSPDHEIIDGFFVGYRSFDTTSLLLDTTSSSGSSVLSSSSSSVNNNKQEQPTFTYKTIRLTNQQPQAASNGGAQQQQSDASSAFLSPISSVTKNVPFNPVGGQFTFGLPTHSTTSLLQPQQQQQQSQVVVVSTFEYVINGLERNTEYTILIQCFNKKGAGPTSDPVVFKTFMNDPPDKLALNADEVSESSVKVSWGFISSEPHTSSLSSITSAAKAADLVDGYVLTFAKLAPRKTTKQQQQDQGGQNSNNNRITAHYLAQESDNQSVNRSADPAVRISTLQQQQQHQSGNNAFVDQWQAIQLAPQQRSHQLKNLECGTSYAMKIWAFNKIGKGEPSDLVTVSTRGKAPVAPDRRSFISPNITQARLHLSAWYDGGCDIDKFLIQYRARGQQEWILLSNNVPKTQVSVLIPDLLPANTYELLVSAQNQVGPTEVRYRFTTLDADGKQVSPLPTLSDDASSSGGLGDDYSDDGSTSIRRDSSSTSYKPLVMFRQLLNSPLALILSLCLFVALLLAIIFYRFNDHLSTSSTGTLSSSTHKSNGGGGRHSSLGEATTTIIGDGDLGGPLSVANGSLADSPRIHHLHSVASHRLHHAAGFPQAASECHYQSFCGGASSGGGSQQQQVVDYGRSHLTTGQECSPAYVPAGYGHHQKASNNYSTMVGQAAAAAYASVQRSATMDPTGGGGLVTDGNTCVDQQRQQCLMQMLMMGSQQPQAGAETNDNLDGHNSYVTAALTTLSRGSGKMGNNMKALSHLQDNNNTYNNAYSNTLSGRHFMDNYHHHQQQQQQFNGYSGKQLTITTADADNLIVSARDQQPNNHFQSTATTTTNKLLLQNNRMEEVYPMSTFKRHDPCDGGGRSGGGGGSTSTATSTSGCGTATSGSAAQIHLQSEHNNNHLMPFIDSASEKSMLSTSSSSHHQLHQQQQQQQQENNGIGGSFDQKTCDNNHSSSQYDVPFKIVNLHTLT